jgi:phenylalanyl-tRNA synthetase beta chain
MKISRNWLQTMFADPLPSAAELGDALTFHAFEIEDIANGDILDVKVTPNRGHDCLCHVGIGKELAAILQMPLKVDPLRDTPDLSQSTERVQVTIDTPLCARYIAGYMTGVKVGPSPQWLVERLEAMGQKSINNIVDATNFAMFHLGQPLHAFDAGKIEQKDGKFTIAVRTAREGEKMLALDEKEYTLGSSMLVIADSNKNEAIGIAGVKGGMPAGITEETKDIIIEAANFDGVATRKTAQALKLRTDASQRFEQVISPELAAYGMHMVANLILDLAGGQQQGFVDVYPTKQEKREVFVTLEKVQQVLGTTFEEKDITDSFARLGFSFKQKEEEYIVAVPFERLDITIPEDLVEEVGRIQGYDRVPAVPLPEFPKPIEVNKNFYKAEKIRQFLLERGFSEVYTSVFAESGERVVLNKVDGVRPYLRENVADGLAEALERNIRNKELLGLKQVKLFEIGTIWQGRKEEITYDLAVEPVKKAKSADDYRKEVEAMLAELPIEMMPDSLEPLVVEAMPIDPNLASVRYQPFSKFPYIVRDIAMWTPAGTNEGRVIEEIQAQAGPLCVSVSLFDRFQKEDKVSLAYRLIFQAFDRTLTDEDANAAMDRVYAKMKEEAFEIR